MVENQTHSSGGGPTMTEILNKLLGSAEQTFFLGGLLYAACYGGDYFVTRIFGAKRTA